MAEHLPAHGKSGTNSLLCFALLCFALLACAAFALPPKLSFSHPTGFSRFSAPAGGECVAVSPQPATKHHAAAERGPLGEGEARGLTAARRSAAKPASGSRSRSMTGGSGQAGGGGGGAGAPQPALP